MIEQAAIGERRAKIVQLKFTPMTGQHSEGSGWVNYDNYEPKTL